MAHDLRKVLRLLADKHYQPSAVILDGRTLQSTPESGKRAGYDGYKRKKGSKVHAAVDTLGHLLALKVTAANEQERAQVADWPKPCRRLRGTMSKWHLSIKATPERSPHRPPPNREYASSWSNSQRPGKASSSCPGDGSWNAPLLGQLSLRRLAKDYERLPSSVAGLHWLAFLTLMLNAFFHQSA